MAHPHNESRDHKVQKRRVGHILKHYASGGAVHHEDEGADKKLIKRTVKKTALKMDGGKPKHRADKMKRARGGRTKHKGTTVNIVMPQGGMHPGAGAPMPGGAPMMPPPHPMAPPMPPAGAMPPPGGPPGMGMPPGGPPMMPPRKQGGRVKRAIGGFAGQTAMPQGMPAPMPTPMPTGSAGVNPASTARPMAGFGGGQMMPPVNPAASSMATMPTTQNRMFAKGGAVKDGPAWKEGLRNGTQVQHDDGKKDGKDIGRGRVVTFRTGGKVEAPEGVAPATKLPGGSGGARARLAKEKRAERGYAKVH
jgi:hypothetical protein